MEKFRDITGTIDSTRAAALQRPPSLTDLVESVDGCINKFVLLRGPCLATVIASWVALAYLFDRFHYCGYLSVQSATPRSGKSRLLRLIAVFSNGAPPITANRTPASIFRSSRSVLILVRRTGLETQTKNNSRSLCKC